MRHSGCRKQRSLGEFPAKVCDLTNQAFALGNEHSNSKLVRKALRSLPERVNIKVATIEKTEDIEDMNLEETKKDKLKCKKNIVFLVTEIVPTERSTMIKEMQE